MLEAQVAEGFWGTWRRSAVCPAETRARGYQARVEAPTGDGDETALNAVRLLCGRDGAGAYGVQSAAGYKGAWSDPIYCPGSTYITGATLRIQPKQGSDKDDTAANDVQCDITATSTVIYAYGFADDIDVCEALYSSLLVQMVRASDA